MDLSPYKTLLNKLVPLSYHNDLDGLIDNLLPGASEETRFQLQAEVSRLTTPCLRVLDLRSLFPGQCELLRHQGLDHMLPERLAQRFHRLLSEYQGDYTRGLYEALLADLAALRKLPSQFNTVPWHLPALGLQRKESRLRFVTPVCFHLANNKLLHGNTLDISPAGLLVQLQEARRLPEEVLISLPELAKQSAFSCLATPKRYRVHQDENDLARIKMQRVEEDANWQQALKAFIEQNKPRYGLDAEDLYSTVRSQCWGQVLLETSSSLSLFFDSQGELQHLLANRFSKKTLTTWQQDHPGDLLPTLLSPQRVLELANQPLTSTLLYSFSRPGQQQTYYFVASQEQLMQHQAYATFINEGLSTNTLACYYVTVRPLHYSDQATANLDVQGVRQLQQLKWQLWLTPLPTPNDEFLEQSEPNQLAPFLAQPLLHKATLTPLGRQASKRQEARFKLETAVEVNVAGQVFKGQTEDLSNSGIKLILDKPVRLEIPCLVQVHLTELSKRSRQTKLKALPYRVVNLSGNGRVLHLRIEGAEETHPAYQFFIALFEQNQDKLRARPEASHTPAWLTWLTRQTLQQPPSPTFLLARNEGGFYVQGAIACLLQQGLMSFLSNEFQQAHFSQLISRQQWQPIYSQLLRPDGRNHIHCEVWTAKAVGHNKQNILFVNPDTTNQALLLDPSRCQELTVSLLIINRLQLRQLEYFVPKWETLTQTSLYKTQQLEQQLAELCALSQVFDITESVKNVAQLKRAGQGPATTPVLPPDSAD